MTYEDINDIVYPCNSSLGVSKATRWIETALYNSAWFIVNDVMCIQQFAVEQLDDMFYDSCNLFVDRTSGLFTSIFLGAKV